MVDHSFATLAPTFFPRIPIKNEMTASLNASFTSPVTICLKWKTLVRMRVPKALTSVIRVLPRTGNVSILCMLDDIQEASSPFFRQQIRLSSSNQQNWNCYLANSLFHCCNVMFVGLGSSLQESNGKRSIPAVSPTMAATMPGCINTGSLKVNTPTHQLKDNKRPTRSQDRIYRPMPSPLSRTVIQWSQIPIWQLKTGPSSDFL